MFENQLLQIKNQYASPLSLLPISVTPLNLVKMKQI